ncbi:MAG: hypothetical protein KGZ55_05200 [Sphingomonadaceae bacterium]|nr:hypothetical protein [Sphingomonadaceae bacterium]
MLAAQPHIDLACTRLKRAIVKFLSLRLAPILRVSASPRETNLAQITK